MEGAYPPYKANGQSRGKSRLFAFFDMITSKRLAKADSVRMHSGRQHMARTRPLTCLARLKP
jgi:hypothetical protein